MLALNIAFKLFREEAKRKKAEVKRGNFPVIEYSSWVIQQEAVIDSMIKNDGTSFKIH